MPGLRGGSLMQYELLEKREFPVVILISGSTAGQERNHQPALFVDGPAHISTLAFSDADRRGSASARSWRYWRWRAAERERSVFFRFLVFATNCRPHWERK